MEARILRLLTIWGNQFRLIIDSTIKERTTQGDACGVGYLKILAHIFQSRTRHFLLLLWSIITIQLKHQKLFFIGLEVETLLCTQHAYLATFWELCVVKQPVYIESISPNTSQSVHNQSNWFLWDETFYVNGRVPWISPHSAIFVYLSNYFQVGPTFKYMEIRSILAI